MASNFADVRAFHKKFGVPDPDYPRLLTPDVADFRVGFMQEELDEFKEAIVNHDLPKAFDALLDLVYVAMGTGVLMGVPWQDGWDEVQRANMSKERAMSAEHSLKETGRGHAFDVVKPEGFVPPDLAEVLTRYVKLLSDRDQPVPR